MAENADAFRAEVKAWLDENFPKSLAGKAGEVMGHDKMDPKHTDAIEWGKRLGAKGWGTPTWPAEYGGGGLSQLEAGILNQEIDAAGAFNPCLLYTSDAADE